MKKIIFISLQLYIFIITSCSSGSTAPPISGNYGYLSFAESSLTIKVAESAQMSLILMDSDLMNLPTIDLYSTESGIVQLDPNTCTFSNTSPLFCNFTIIGLSPGTTQIGFTPILPGRPMTVTVLNQE